MFCRQIQDKLLICLFLNISIMETLKIKNYIMFQFGLLIMILASLPQFNLLAIISGFDLFGTICKIIAYVMILFSFDKLRKMDIKEITIKTPLVLFLLAFQVILLLFVFNVKVPVWIEYIGIILLGCAFYLSEKTFKISWTKISSYGAYLILIGLLLSQYKNIDSSTLTSIAAFIGFVIYWIGLGKFKDSLEEKGINCVSKLKTAIILGICASVIGFIPLIGLIPAAILRLIAFVFEFMGYSILRESETLGEKGQKGASMLRTSMIIFMIGTIIGFIPILGTWVKFICSIIGIYFIFSGWTSILISLEGEKEESDEVVSELAEPIA